MRKAVAEWKKACEEAKCERCRAESQDGLDMACGECLMRLPDYPEIKTKPGKDASLLYDYLKLNTEEDIVIDDLIVRFPVSRSRIRALVKQLQERGLVEVREPFVWAWEGRSLS